jgi:hypothetical protein
MKSENDHQFSDKQILLRIAAAILFGAAFWLMLDLVQPLLLTPLYGYEDCCERCKNILYDKGQPLLAASAVIAFFVGFVFEPQGLERDCQSHCGLLAVFLDLSGADGMAHYSP